MAKQGLLDHPKTADLADRLDIDISDAVGLLECLFHFTGKYASNGLIGRWSDRAIVDGMRTRRPIQAVIQALAGSGWIITAEQEAEKLGCLCPSDHEKWYVHNWHVHAQTWVRQKLIEEGETFFFGHPAERPRGRQPSNGLPPRNQEKTENKPGETDSQIENKSFVNDLESIKKSESNPNQTVISSRASLPSAKAIAKQESSSNPKERGRDVETGSGGSPPGSAQVLPVGGRADPNQPPVRTMPEEDFEAKRRQLREQVQASRAGGGR